MIAANVGDVLRVIDDSGAFTRGLREYVFTIDHIVGRAGIGGNEVPRHMTGWYLGYEGWIGVEAERLI